MPLSGLPTKKHACKNLGLYELINKVFFYYNYRQNGKIIIVNLEVKVIMNWCCLNSTRSVLIHHSAYPMLIISKPA